MKNLYFAACKKAWLFSLFIFFFLFRVSAQNIVTYDTTFDGWNAIVTMDKALTGTDSAAGIVFFPGLGEQTTDSAALVVNGPHYLIRNGLWDGSVPLANGVHHPFIISLQPPAPGSPATVVKPKIDAILARYRIKRNSFYFTGLSQGGWQANEFITYEPTAGDFTYGRLVKAMVALEGVEPADNTGPYQSVGSYPTKMGTWAAQCGGRELWVEGSNDWRDMEAGAQSMIDSGSAASATYFMVTYGGGAHCCWNTEYDPSTTWTMPSNPNISQVYGTPQPMNVWQWLLRQGDTSMPTYSGVPPTPVAPTLSASGGTTITLPVSSVTLSGTATGNNGATISSTVWTQVSGPGTATIGSGTSLTPTMSDLVAGTYEFELTATDNNGLTGTATVTVIVNAAVTPPPTPVAPTVSASGGTTITLPVSSVTLNGTATGNNGATISSTVWTQVSGPGTATIGSGTSLTPTMSDLVAGTYEFELTATDNNGLTGTATVTVIVNAAVTPPPTPVAPTVSASGGTTITLPVSSVTLNGTATGNNGATISSTVWTQVSGPGTATIGSGTSLTPTMSDLVAGTYEFELTATDNDGLTGTATVTVIVNAAVTPPPVTQTPPVAIAGSNRTVSLSLTGLALDGSASYATTAGATIISYSWVQVSGMGGVTIVGSNTANPEIDGMGVGTYVFSLTVTDNDGLTGTATVTITVEAGDPEAEAGQDTTIAYPASTAVLNGSGSTDPSGEMLSYTWTEVSGPGTAVIANPGSATSTVSALQTGLYVFELTVTNSSGQSDTATVEVTVVNNERTSGSQGNAQVLVYPNPVEGELHIRFTDASTSGQVVMRIYDMRGTLVKSQETVLAGEGQEATLDMSTVAKGAYMLQIIIGNKATYQLVVKQ